MATDGAPPSKVFVKPAAVPSLCRKETHEHLRQGLDVPADVLDALRIRPGDSVHFRVESGRALLQKAPDVHDPAGAVEVPPDKRGLSWEETRRQARAAWVAEFS